MESNLGKLFESKTCKPVDVRLIASTLNLGNQALGDTFPSFAKVGNEAAKVLVDLLRNQLTTDVGQGLAVQGIRALARNIMTAEDCANWFCIFNFALAFFEFCKLAAPSPHRKLKMQETPF
jgi:hypothetical protein